MATITPATASSSSPVLCNPVASAPAGDEITVAVTQSLLVVFDNGHSSPITVTLGGQASAITVGGKGAGSFTPTSKTLSVVNATTRVFYIPQTEIAGFRNGNGRVEVTYASGNASLTVQAIVV